MTNKLLEKQKIAGKLLTELLSDLRDKSEEWVNLLDLEWYSEQFMKMNNVKSAFKWYGDYPANICLSVNECVVHGAPHDYELKKWDVLKVDAGINYEWWLADAAFTIIVWGDKENKQWSELIKATKWALDNGLKFIKPGKSIYDFGFAVNDYVKSKWFSILKNLTGHGIWKEVHQNPHIYNYGEPKVRNVFWKEWQVVCLEPITAIRSKKSVERNGIEHNLYCERWDIWAQWEYMVLVTKSGVEILAGLE